MRRLGLVTILTLFVLSAVVPAGHADSGDSISVSIGFLPIGAEIGVMPRSVPARTPAGVVIEVRNDTGATIDDVTVSLNTPPGVRRSPANRTDLGDLGRLQEVSHFWLVCAERPGIYEITAQVRAGDLVVTTDSVALTVTLPARRPQC